MEAAAALCSGRTLHGHGIAELASCYGKVSETSLESPRPPMAVSRQGRRETSRFRLPSLHPYLLAAIPVRPPGGSPLLALPSLFPCVSLIWFPAMARCRKLVSPPLSPPARPSGGSAGVQGGQSYLLGLPAPLRCRHSPVRPPGGSPVACSFLALQLFAACSLLVFHHFLDFTKIICYAIVIIDLRIFTFCPKSQIFLNKLCLSSWLKIAGYMSSNISPPPKKSGLTRIRVR